MIIIKKQFRNYKRNAATFWLAFLVFFLSIILITSIYNHPEIYKTVVLRVSIFFLGAITTINVYIYGKVLSVSPTQFTSTVRAKWMLLGVICSFGLLIIIPPNFYNMPPMGLDYIKKVWYTSWTFEKVISAISLLFFVLSTTIFITSLFNFVSSFDVKRTVKKNYKNITELNVLKRFFKLDYKVNKKKIGKQNNKKHQSLNYKAYSTPLSKDEIDILIKDLEIFTDNLSYLISLNHSEYIREFIDDWGKVCGHIQSRIYHSNNIDDEYERLYLKTLEGTVKIIDKTVSDINLKTHFEKTLNIFLLSLPLFKEDLGENFKKRYSKNYNKLAFIYYKQLLSLIEYIYFDIKHRDLLNILLHDETFNSIVIENYSFVKNIANIRVESKDYNEHLLLGILYKSVSHNSNIDLPIIIALITKTQAVKTKDREKNLFTDSTKKTAKDINKMFNSITKKNENTSEWNSWFENAKKTDVKFSNDILSFLIIIIVKACEIENYKAAGYLVKRICSSSDYYQIMQVIETLNDTIYDSNQRNLSMLNITLNDYSLKYCFNKTIFLLLLQIGYEQNLKINFKKWIASKFRISILNSFKEKHKEYNLYCINDEYLKKLKLISTKVD